MRLIAIPIGYQLNPDKIAPPSMDYATNEEMIKEGYLVGINAPLPLVSFIPSGYMINPDNGNNHSYEDFVECGWTDYKLIMEKMIIPKVATIEPIELIDMLVTAEDWGKICRVESVSKEKRIIELFGEEFKIDDHFLLYSSDKGETWKSFTTLLEEKARNE